MKIIISVVFLGETAAAVAVSGGGTAAGGIAVAKSNETSPWSKLLQLVEFTSNSNYHSQNIDESQTLIKEIEAEPDQMYRATKIKYLFHLDLKKGREILDTFPL